MKENYVPRGGKIFQRQTGLDLEHKNLLVSILVEDLLLDIQKQIENNVVGWVGQPFEVILVANQFFEELKITIFVLQIESLQEQKCSSRSNSKPIFFTNPKPPL